jgi:hypothetical protein
MALNVSGSETMAAFSRCSLLVAHYFAMSFLTRWVESIGNHLQPKERQKP